MSGANEAELLAVVKAARALLGWADRASTREGDAGCDFLNEGGWDELDPLADALRSALVELDRRNP